MAISEQSAEATVAAVRGQNTSTGNGVHGISATGFGVVGESTTGRGVVARSDTNYGLRAASRTLAGIRGSSEMSRGVEGWATVSEGVVGISKTGNGVWGQTEEGTGVLGTSKKGIGVVGDSETNDGVRGVGRSPHHGVVGINVTPPSGPNMIIRRPGNGGWFESDLGEGVRGTSKNADHGGVVGVNTAGGAGVYGSSDTGVGVWGVSRDYEAVHAETRSTRASAMAVYQNNGDSQTAALYVKHAGNRNAALFVGNIEVTGNIDVTGDGSDIRLINADCAEDFPVSGDERIEPGTVMVLGEEGALFESRQAYDKRVAGVISGAGNYKPAIVLDAQRNSENRQPIALMGKVFCKVDAQFGAIAVGDLLTTSPTPGHAMTVSDPVRAFGAIIGKALRPLATGSGLIPILVALQ